MTAAETRRLNEFPLFDWLRITVAIVVAASHARLIRWGEAGDLGVQLFFALSGWLIGTILIEMRRDKLPIFYFNRATRVWTPYFAAVAVLYGLSAVRDHVDARWFEFLTYDITFTHNWFSLLPNRLRAISEMPLGGTGQYFWSLAVEEQFYLAAPLIILFMPGGRSVATWLAVAVVALLVRPQFAAIALGVTAAAAHHARPNFQLNRRIASGFALLLLLTAPLMAVEWLYARAAPFFSIAAVVLLARPGPRGSIGMFLGGISYPLYLNHWTALFIAHGIAKHANLYEPAAALLIAMPAAVIVAAIAYLLIDRPVLARRHGWYTLARGRALAASAYALLAVGIVIGLSLRVL